MLINKLDQDYGKDFIISMAPIQYSLITNNTGIGGFVYKDLYNSNEGKRINYFNCQAYSDYSFESFCEIVKNGYDPSKIVYGMISYQESTEINKEIIKIFKKNINFGGVFDWEFFDAKPTPLKWSYIMDNIFKTKQKID